MWTVLMNQDARAVVHIESVAADMRPLVDDQYLRAETVREPLSHYGAGEAGPHYEPIKHEAFSPRAARVSSGPDRCWRMTRAPAADDRLNGSARGVHVFTTRGQYIGCFAN